VTWDTACDFLLGLYWENLFEQTGPSHMERHRCKGCGEVMARRKRRAHFDRHVARKALQRDRARLDGLAKARKAAARLRKPPARPARPEPVILTEEELHGLPAAPESFQEAVEQARPGTRLVSIPLPPPPPPLPQRLF